MAEIINLNQYRKNRLRQERRKTAETNRVKFGRRKPERQRDDAEREQLQSNLDHHRLTTDAKPEDGQSES